MSNESTRRGHALLGRAGLVAVVALLAWASVAGAATQVRRYTPYTAVGEIKPSVRIARQIDGNCWAGGLGGRPDEWRCTTDRPRPVIYDPCFESPIADIAVCPGFPGRRAVVLTTPDFARDAQNAGGRAFVWAVRAGGHPCAAFMGTRSELRGRLPVFACQRGTSAVWGGLDRSRPTWRALFGRFDPDRWRWANVSVAWR